ncbi:MAG TPA: GNAT family N-acetyltransferase [Rhizomicrobium sp.]|nr:GNAT family N-acetyltransferase [Rhizomicrobium sp.]
MSMIPCLETERLILREWRAGDMDAFAAIYRDAEVMRYLSGEPLARNEAWRNMAAAAGHWVLRGYGTWVVERKSDGAAIGRVGLINPEGWPALEVGWTLGRSYWGNGYATEAARASMNYGFLTQPVDKLISLIDPDNTASQAVARRLGETQGPEYELVLAGKRYATHIWSIAREEWRKRAMLP